MAHPTLLNRVQWQALQLLESSAVQSLSTLHPDVPSKGSLTLLPHLCCRPKPPPAPASKHAVGPSRTTPAEACSSISKGVLTVLKRNQRQRKRKIEYWTTSRAVCGPESRAGCGRETLIKKKSLCLKLRLQQKASHAKCAGTLLSADAALLLQLCVLLCEKQKRSVRESCSVLFSSVAADPPRPAD